MKKIIILIPLLFVTTLNSYYYPSYKYFSYFKKGMMGPVKVYYHIPKKFNLTLSPLIAMHGTTRNAKSMISVWKNYAETGGYLLLAPEFSKKYYPKSYHYHLGNVINKKRKINKKSQWAFQAIEDIFDQAKKQFLVTSKRYNIFGHSAGGQFVHRFVFHMKKARYKYAIAANAGWYTFPDFSKYYGAGLKTTPVTEDDLKTIFQRKVIILLGERDNNPYGKFVPKGRSARAQGRHRYERGTNFFKYSSDYAKKLSVSFIWKKITVPGVGHSSRGVALPIAHLFYPPSMKNVLYYSNGSDWKNGVVGRFRCFPYNGKYRIYPFKMGGSMRMSRRLRFRSRNNILIKTSIYPFGNYKPNSGQKNQYLGIYLGAGRNGYIFGQYADGRPCIILRQNGKKSYFKGKDAEVFNHRKKIEITILIKDNKAVFYNNMKYIATIKLNTSIKLTRSGLYASKIGLDMENFEIRQCPCL